ncbi:(p)ppGpp synthetase, partial [candidate division KSB1 bacterium]
MRRLNGLLRNIKKYHKQADLELIKKAFYYSYKAHKGQLRLSGKPYFEHPLEVARILVKLKMDVNTIIAGLLHDVVEDTGINMKDIEEEFGGQIAYLVNGVTKIGELIFEKREVRQAENFRKMLLSMAKDLRVILIKFADRLHNMRTLDFLPEKKREQIALETLNVYAPLAHRFGIATIKWELEDLSFKYLEPEIYRALDRKIKESRKEREEYIESIKKPLKKELEKMGISAEIDGRPKNFYSIYRKMQSRNQSFENIYDLHALRIIVNKIEECYFALGIVHTLYNPVQGRFKDYIAMPKLNGYQSIHTTVLGPEGKLIEFQIRTIEMHKTAEFGIAAHWKYKEGKTTDDELDRHLSWMRQLVDWQIDTFDPMEFMEILKIDLYQDEVFVFSPKGDLFKLPKGATPIDFAFAVHSDVGLHCIGSKVNGRIVPLNSELKSGDTVEIITSPNQKPNQDWIKFVKTSKARSRIKRWIRDSMREQSIKLGKEILEKELYRYKRKLSNQILKEIVNKMEFPNEEALFASLGTGEISVKAIVNKILPGEEIIIKGDKAVEKYISRARKSVRGIKVQGENNLMINFGKCCQPVPGDDIIGFITKGKGVMIHRRDCSNIAQLLAEPERNVSVEWDVDDNTEFMVGIHILGNDRKYLLRDITDKISTTNTNIVSVNMNVEDSIVSGNIILQVKNLEHLTKVIRNLLKIEDV